MNVRYTANEIQDLCEMRTMVIHSLPLSMKNTKQEVW